MKKHIAIFLMIMALLLFLLEGIINPLPSLPLDYLPRLLIFFLGAFGFGLIMGTD